MGSDLKSKKKRSPAPEEDEQEMNKRRKTTSSTETNKIHHHRNKHKDKKHQASTTQEGKPEEKHKHRRKHHKRDRREISNFKELSDADYFLKNNEFATWLKDERGTFFSDLSSVSSHKLFTKFVKYWNNKKLDSKYYDGIVAGPRSSHNWKIKSDTKEGDPLNQRGKYNQMTS